MRTQIPRVGTLVLFLGVLTPTAPARAESIAVTGLVYQEGRLGVKWVDLHSAASDFALSGFTDSGFTGDFMCVPCRPGTTVNLTFTFAYVYGTLHYRDEQFPIGVNTPSVMSLQAGTYRLVSATPGLHRIEMPFTFNASLYPDPLAPQRLFQLHGTGRLTAIYEGYLNVTQPGDIRENFFLFRSLQHDFDDPAAAPEPATLGLVGAGMVGAFIRRRRQRAAR